MDKDITGEERRRVDNGDKFNNEFVENSLKNELTPPKQPPSGELTSDDSEREPNGMDPETIFEKGLSFQETPEEHHLQRMNRYGKEPNGINPQDR